MSELRQDRTSGMWVIVAPERKQRPWDWEATLKHAAVSDADRHDCPFCPGHESLLPTVLAEIRQEGPPGWMARAVPNRYPALQMTNGQTIADVDNHCRRDGHGHHEIIIESPRHDADLDNLSGTDVEAALTMYQRRYLAIADMTGIEWVVIFRNHGERAGSSLRHPHAQLISLPLTSSLYRTVEAWSRTSYENAGRCVVCREIDDERQSGLRLVEETDDFVTVVPFASTRPFELWIVPKRHAASFGAAGAEELASLAHAMRGALRRLKRAAGEVPYNIVVDSACRSSTHAPFLHWKVRILPELTTPGGFEIGTAIRINPSLPETDAQSLRRAMP